MQLNRQWQIHALKTLPHFKSLLVRAFYKGIVGYQNAFSLVQTAGTTAY